MFRSIDRSIEREREREREREKRNKQKPGAFVNLMWRFLYVFLSPVDEQESTLTNENKSETPLLLSDSTSHVRLSFLVNWQDMICVHDCVPRRERQLVNSISDVETGLELFHSESTIDLPRTGKIRWQNVCCNNCSFTLKEKSDGDDMVRHKSSKLKKHNANQGIYWSNDSCRKLAECGPTGNASLEPGPSRARYFPRDMLLLTTTARRDRLYGTPW